MPRFIRTNTLYDALFLKSFYSLGNPSSRITSYIC